MPEIRATSGPMARVTFMRMSRSRGAVSVASALARHRKGVAAAVVRKAMPVSVRSYRRRSLHDARHR